VQKLLLLALVGFAAQFVGGALGMGKGVIASTLLLLTGVGPASASAAVHLAEVGTTLATGASHWRFGNVDWRVVARIGLPGALSAFAGATLLSAVSTEAAGPWMASILFALGAYLLVRFSRPVAPAAAGRPPGGRFLAPVGLAAGFVDATGGGGWGAVATPSLLVSGRMEPRKVVGSVSTAQFAVASSASAGFLVGLGSHGVAWSTVLAMLAGGVVAAPVAAWLVRIVPAQLLGAGVGGLILLTNARTLLRPFDVPGAARGSVYIGLALAWAVAAVCAVRVLRRTRREKARQRQVRVPALDPA
jgi:uncharacterized membrane protein YfcA